ncbi:zinc-ribbon domain-containing protein [Thermodesulfobacteriota bacterium]
MEIICPSCNTKLNVPDEKIPKDQMVRINCPKCKNKISIEPSGKTGGASPSQEENFDETGKLHLKFIESQKKEAEGQKSSDYEDFSSDESLDYYDDDAKLALIMVDESLGDKVKSAVEEYGYKSIETPNTRDALSKMRFHHFDLIILGDGFDGQEIVGGPVMNYLNHLGMSTRRRMFLVLIGDKHKTMDDMMAYALSANMIVNTKDLEKLSGLLKRGISEYEKFYKVYIDTLVEEGKI